MDDRILPAPEVLRQLGPSGLADPVGASTLGNRRRVHRRVARWAHAVRDAIGRLGSLVEHDRHVVRGPPTGAKGNHCANSRGTMKAFRPSSFATLTAALAASAVA